MPKDSPIPKDAREVYCNEKGEPIAFIHKDNLGLLDLIRAEFLRMNLTRIEELGLRAKEKTEQDKDGARWAVCCIEVDDLTPATNDPHPQTVGRWCWLVELLMPNSTGHWAEIRAAGMQPVARGVVPHDMMADITREAYPAAGEPIPGHVNIFVFSAGGILIVTGPEFEKGDHHG